MRSALLSCTGCHDTSMLALQIGVDYYKQANFIRFWSSKHATEPLSQMEALMGSAATMAIVYNEDTTPQSRAKRLSNAACIVCVTESGIPARLISKYRPPAVIFCVSSNARAVRQARTCLLQTHILGNSLHNTAAAHAEVGMRTCSTAARHADANADALMCAGKCTVWCLWRAGQRHAAVARAAH